MRALPLLFAAALMAGSPRGTSASEPTTAPSPATGAEAQWQELEALMNNSLSPQTPEEWEKKMPDEATLEAWKKSEAERLLKLSERFEQFAKEHPDHPKARTAQSAEHAALGQALDLGSEEAGRKIDTLLAELLKNPDLSPSERYVYRFGQLVRAAQTPEALEAAARQLKKEFPDRDDHEQLLLRIAQQLPPERALAIADEVLASNADEATKATAKLLKEQLQQIGKPIELKFTALDGREVDTRKLRGKVVLIDFWATWCVPCLNALPTLKELNERFQSKGLEIIGVSLDEDKEALEKLVGEEKLPWPQRFDPKGFESEQIRAFGITAIPTVWLIDKKGVLRDTNGEIDLEKKIEALLAEE